MKYLTVTAAMTLAFILTIALAISGCSGRQPPGGDLWKIPKYVEQHR